MRVLVDDRDDELVVETLDETVDRRMRVVTSLYATCHDVHAQLVQLALDVAPVVPVAYAFVVASQPVADTLYQQT